MSYVADGSITAVKPARRLARYLPLVLWIGFIFFASSGQMSASETSRFVAPVVRWFFPDIDGETLKTIHIFVRKTAHFVEYALLALIAARAFLTSSRSVLRRNWFALSFVLVAIVALFDEYNQSFYATRTGTIYDSLLDMTGGLAALAAGALWRRRKKHQDEV